MNQIKMGELNQEFPSGTASDTETARRFALCQRQSCLKMGNRKRLSRYFFFDGTF